MGSGVRRGRAGGLLEGVLDLLAGLLEVALRLVPLTGGLEVAVVGGVAEGFLGLAAHLFELVVHLVFAAHVAHSFGGVVAVSPRFYPLVTVPTPAIRLWRNLSCLGAVLAQSRRTTWGAWCRSCGCGTDPEARSQLDDERGHPRDRVPRVHPSYQGGVCLPGALSS